MSIASQATESIVQAKGEATAETRVKFLDALWRDSAPRLLLPLAEAANMTPEQADRIRGQIAEARRLMKLANGMPEARKAFAIAQQQAEKAAAKVAALRSEATAIETTAATAFSAAHTAASAASSACQELVNLSERDPLLLPQSRLPDAAKALIVRQAADAERRAAEAAANEKQQRIRTLERELGTVKGKLRQTLPFCSSRPGLQAEIARLETALKAARTEATA